ncbi:leucine-rich repeat-containing protein 75A-like [Sceloporus undulatus]|uniref:leucine-rich repeat-containing protein 75A-like n=1 Tax=Sceloporus undulatus TaxID=8520 RepID=UPI001C4CD3B9|nr:leucine-rich repeat-containing protein 75A-like [Sceloporus undulatus]
MGAKQTKAGCALPSAEEGGQVPRVPRPRRRLLSSSPSWPWPWWPPGGELLAALHPPPAPPSPSPSPPSGSVSAPYLRRVGLVQELLRLAKQGRRHEATLLLRSLRQDLGLESTSLDDVLYRYASFRNLVDPISHDLILGLARYIHCPRAEGDSLGALEKLCRQLTYHLSPHSQWRRQGLVKKKPHACLKAVLVGNPLDNTVDLSGIPLTPKDLERVAAYLRSSSSLVENVELCFTELTDEMFLQLLPVLSALPRLATLSLNGNRLTKAVLRDLTEALKDPRNFPSVTWIDLGNNVDIFSLPQPFLVSLKKRCPTQGSLPTILEFGEGQASDTEGQESLSPSRVRDTPADGPEMVEVRLWPGASDTEAAVVAAPGFVQT